MADKAKGQTGASTPKKGISKMEAVRQALGHFGNDAKPLEMRPLIKQQFGIDMSTDHISTYKGDIRKKADKAKAPAPAAKAAAASSSVTPQPAAHRPPATATTTSRPTARHRPAIPRARRFRL